MDRRIFLKNIGKMTVLLASASAFPGLVVSGEANKINVEEDIWPKKHGVMEVLEGRPVCAGGKDRTGYESYLSSEYTDSKTPDADLIEMISNSFKKMCKENGFSEMVDLTYQTNYLPMARNVGDTPYLHAWGANFR